MSFRLARHACAVALALSIPAAFGQSFSQFYFFGDSLTDGGAFGGINGLPSKGRWVLNDAPNYADYLAGRYGLSVTAVNVANPNTNQNGNNFAEGGAQSTNVSNTISTPPITGTPIRNLPQQVTDYLTRTGGKADSNAAYVVWSGGNDIPAAASNPATAASYMTNAAQSVLKQAGTLKQLGAGLVIVPNVPNFANTPAALYASIQGYAAATGTSANLNNAIGAAWQALSAGSNNSTATEQATIGNAISAAAVALGGPATAAGLSTVQAQNAASLGQLATLYNTSVNAGLTTLGNNVLRPDVAGLFNEMLLNPALYGFSNATGSACAPSTSTDNSLTCTSAGVPFKNQSYVFSDDRHPSPLTHQVLGQYMISLLTAPAFAAALPEAGLNASRQLGDALDSRYQVLKGQSRAVGTVGAFASAGWRPDNTQIGDISGKQRSQQLTLGFDVQATPSLSWGVAVSAGKDRVSAADQGYFDQSKVLMSGLLNYQSNNIWANGDLHVGSGNYSTYRNVQLGTNNRVMTGEARGTQLGLRTTGGYQLQYGQISTGPRVGLAVERVKVGSLTESGLSSTSMSFGSQRVTSTIGRIGWDIGTTVGRFSPYANVSWAHEFGNKSRSIDTSLTTQAGGFQYQVAGSNSNWAEYQLGTTAKITDKLNGILSVAATSGRNNGNQKAINLGVSANF